MRTAVARGIPISLNSPPAHLADVESFVEFLAVGEVGEKVMRDGSPLKQPNFIDRPSLLPEDFAEVHAGFLVFGARTGRDGDGDGGGGQSPVNSGYTRPFEGWYMYVGRHCEAGYVATHAAAGCTSTSTSAAVSTVYTTKQWWKLAYVPRHRGASG